MAVMPVKGETTERQTRTNNSKDGSNQRVDRLSSLPDDIRIQIISLLRIKLAVVTGSLSKRWLRLWTNLTSIQIYGSLGQYRSPEFFDSVDKIMNQIASPFIHSFSVSFLSKFANSRWEFSLDSWLRKVCDGNIRELKVTCHDELPDYIFRLSSYIFQTKSLVSIELDTDFGWQLPDPINLPNLKSLSVRIYLSQWEWIEKLIEACSSLEKLSLVGDLSWKGKGCLKCSNQNITSLKLVSNNHYNYHEVVINTPKLEYLDVCVPHDVRIRFAEEPIVLREAKIVHYYYRLEGDTSFMAEFDRSVCNVTILTLDAFMLENISTLFRNTTQLTLIMEKSYNIVKVLTALELFPVLDILTLQFGDISDYSRKWNTWIPPLFPADEISTLRHRIARRIQIEARWQTYHKPMKSFLQLVEYLLSHPKDLEHFIFSVVGKDFSEERLEHIRNTELELCKLLHRCPTVSTECEVEFKGRFFKMSRKAGPEAWTTKGRLIPLNFL